MLHEAHLPCFRILHLLVVPTELEAEYSEEEAERRRDRKGVATAKIEEPLPVFTGLNIVFWAKDFVRLLRLMGQTKASDLIKADLVLTGCKTDWLRKLLEDLLTESATLVEFIATIEETFPVFETDMPIYQQLLFRLLKLHGQNHTKCTQFGPCKKKVFHRLRFLKTEY